MKKFWPIFLGVLLIVFYSVGAAGGSKLTEPNKNDLVSKNEQSASLEQTTSDSMDTIVKQPGLKIEVLAQTEDDLPEVTLTVTDGDVFSCGDCTKNASCEYAAVENDLALSAGDAIRTGKDGEATIQFGEEVELTLSANTQIRIKKYEAVDDNTIIIQIEHLIGEVFFKVNSNESSPMIDFALISPTTVIKANEDNTAFSGVSVVSYPAFTELSPEDLESEIAETTAFNNECGVLCGEKNCNNCLDMAELGPIDFNLTDNTGQIDVTYFDENGLQLANLIAGQTFDYQFEELRGNGVWTNLCRALSDIADGLDPSNGDVNAITNNISTKPTVTPPNNCGDGVCDIYENENSTTCPADCN